MLAWQAYEGRCNKRIAKEGRGDVQSEFQPHLIRRVQRLRKKYQPQPLHYSTEMTPKKSSKAPIAQVKTVHSQSDSQDASQDSGLAAGQMTKTFGDRLKQKVLVLVVRTFDHDCG